MTQTESIPPTSHLQSDPIASHSEEQAPRVDRTPPDVHAPIIETVIRPRSGWGSIDWKELASYHELLLFLMWRDFSVRYKQTVLGSLWAILQPLMMMAVFSLVFGRWGGSPHGFPYPVFVFAGLIPWTMFAQGFSQSALSLVNQQQLLTKVYFPRIFVPTAAAAVYVVDLLISLVLYVVFISFYGYTLGWTAIFIPVMILMTFISTLALGLLVSALTVFYRDFRHLVPFITQILLFVSGVIVPLDAMTRRFSWVLALNPVAGAIEGFRSALLGTPCNPVTMAISTTSSLVLFWIGITYFRRTERKFADFA